MDHDSILVGLRFPTTFDSLRLHLRLLLIHADLLEITARVLFLPHCILPPIEYYICCLVPMIPGVVVFILLRMIIILAAVP